MRTVLIFVTAVYLGRGEEGGMGGSTATARSRGEAPPPQAIPPPPAPHHHAMISFVSLGGCP